MAYIHIKSSWVPIQSNAVVATASLDSFKEWWVLSRMLCLLSPSSLLQISFWACENLLRCKPLHPLLFFSCLLFFGNSFSLGICGFGFWFRFFFVLFWGGFFKAFPFWEGLEDFFRARSRWSDTLSGVQPMVTWRTWELGCNPEVLTYLEIRCWVPGVGKRPECGKSWIAQSDWRGRSSACTHRDGRICIALLKLSSSVRNFTSQ